MTTTGKDAGRKATAPVRGGAGGRKKSAGDLAREYWEQKDADKDDPKRNDAVIPTSQRGGRP